MFGTNDDHLVLLFEYGLGSDTRGPWHRLLGESLESPAEMLRSLLAWAITHDQRHRVTLLAEHGVDIVSPFTEPRSPRRGTPVEVALINGHRELADQLLALGARPPRLLAADAFVAAVLAGDADAVQQTPAEVIATVRRKRTGLVTWAAAQGAPNAVELLVAAGFDVNALGRSDIPSNEPWHTALHVAAENGNLALARTLLELGADPNIPDKHYQVHPPRLGPALRPAGPGRAARAPHSRHLALLSPIESGTGLRRCRGRPAPSIHESSVMRYPTLVIVSIAGGSPTLRRSRLIVTVTVLVNGSAFSSHTWAKRSSALRTAGCARIRASSTANSLAERSRRRPSRVAVWCKGSSSIPAARKTPGLGGGPAAGEGADAEHELGKMERLCEVVVGPEDEAADALCRGAGRSEHEHHRWVPLLGDHAANDVPVHPGEVAVENDHVVLVYVELGGCLEPVIGDVHGHPLVLQAVDQGVGQGTRVFDDEDSHARAPAADLTARGRVIARRSPPSPNASRRSVPPWTSMIDETIASPIPTPLSDPVRSAPTRRKGWVSCLTSMGSRTGPPFSTTRCARLPLTAVVTRASRPASLWLTALSTTFSTIRKSSVWLPVTHASGHCCCSTPSPIAEMASARALDGQAGDSPSETVDWSASGPC